jgi:hypothetical protein
MGDHRVHEHAVCRSDAAVEGNGSIIRYDVPLVVTDFAALMSEAAADTDRNVGSDAYIDPGADARRGDTDPRPSAGGFGGVDINRSADPDARDPAAPIGF